MFNRKTLSPGFVCILMFVSATAKDAPDAAANATFVESSTETLESIFLTLDGNKVISPFSVNSALVPLKLGADSQTYRELDSYLKEFELQRAVDDPKAAADISSLTVVFTAVDLVLLPEFKEALNKSKVILRDQFDFRDYEAINDFIKNATNGLIQDLIGPTSLRKDTDMVIINAVHFDAPWEHAFQITFRNIPFTLLDGSVQEIPMMYQKSSNYIAKVNDLDATVLELPYKSYTKVLRIYLPNKFDGLPTLLKRLQTYNSSAISFKLSESEVTIPKFKIETQIKVTSALEKLGLTSLTKSTSNLSKISKKPLRVDEIISKSVIEVGENGTKAGSATGVFVVPLSGFIAEEFIANRSFYFEIRDPTSTSVYFSGIFAVPDVVESSPSESNAPVFVSRLNQPRPDTVPTNGQPALTPGSTQESEDVASETKVGDSETGEGEEGVWWVHAGQPEYLTPATADNVSVTPRFQQPEPIYPSGIRFPYPLIDPHTQIVIDTHLRNTSINAV